MENHRIPVSGRSDVGHACRVAGRVAAAIGFGHEALAELQIVARELATNLATHASAGGVLVVTALEEQGRAGIEIVAQDCGPGIADAELALRDHSSTAGSLGCGLGAVRRLSDEFDFYSRRASGPRAESERPGTIVVARRWLGARPPAGGSSAIQSRPHPGETANGDAAMIAWKPGALFACAIDGMGHGPEAAKAAEAACGYLEKNLWHPDLDALFDGLDASLRTTRGAAVTILRISGPDRSLVHAGVGNVELRVRPEPRAALFPRPGVVGAGRATKPTIREIPWSEGSTAILFSDGVSAQWSHAEPALMARHPATIAARLASAYSRRDDATVAVVRGILAENGTLRD